MALISVTILCCGRCLVPWTVFQADPGVLFSALYTAIACGGVSVIVPTSELSTATLERVFVGASKESLSVVDCSLLIGEVCGLFGRFVRYNVVLDVQAATTDEMSVPNAFTRMMQSSAELAASARKPLPDSVPVRMQVAYL